MADPTFLAAFETLAATVKLAHIAWQTFRADHKTEPAPVPRSEEEFRFVRRLQRQNRRHFALLAYSLPRHAAGRAHFVKSPLLCRDDWIPKEPVLLGKPDEELNDDSNQLVTTGPYRAAGLILNRLGDSELFLNASRDLLPRAPKGTDEYRSLSDAIRAVEKPNSDLFVSRPSYALSKVSGKAPFRLRFEKAEYFDYINCGEFLAYETIREAVRVPEFGNSDHQQYLKAFDERLTLRESVGEWNAISFRPSLAGVNVLTIFVDRQAGAATFPMMHRSRTGSAAGTFHVIPAGEFQPTTNSPVAWRKHCTLWQTVLREFSEELLLDDEAKSGGLDMRALAARDRMAPLLQLIRAGDWKTYYLGMGLDPLTLKPELLLVSVIDLWRFIDALSPLPQMKRLPEQNSEGEICGGPLGWGEVFNSANLSRYRDDPITLPAASGCIELLQRHLAHFPDLHSSQIVGFRDSQ
ncbi:MAG: hypothetical protein IH621_01060 [Krumholzibacteria bacterium]|nr:hypothetical protein [Candidatus Krumholzibacteria bacterium]